MTNHPRTHPANAPCGECRPVHHPAVKKLCKAIEDLEAAIRSARMPILRDEHKEVRAAAFAIRKAAEDFYAASVEFESEPS